MVSVFCPSCHYRPAMDEESACAGCEQPLKVFADGPDCPECRRRAEVVECRMCGTSSAYEAWFHLDPGLPEELYEEALRRGFRREGFYD